MRLQRTRESSLGGERSWCRKTTPPCDSCWRQDARGDYVLVYPYYAMYYFLADVKNPTRYGELIYGPGAKPYFDEAIAAVEARKMKYILWDTTVDADTMKQWFPSYVPPPESDRWMERYFQEQYQQVDILNGFRILRRR